MSSPGMDTVMWATDDGVVDDEVAERRVVVCDVLGGRANNVLTRCVD